MSSTNAAQPASDPRDELLQWIYESECDEFSEELYLYAVAQQKGEPVAERFPALTVHLAHCAQCQELYHELLFMLTSEARAGLAMTQEARQLSTPERSTIHQGIDWLLEQSKELLRVWVRGAAVLATPPWPPQTVAVRGPAGAHQQAWQLSTRTLDPAPTTIADTEIRIALIPDPTDDQRITWQIEVTQPDRWPDFAGISVTLYPAYGEPQRQTTGHDGIVQFPDLPRQDLAAMQIAIELPVK